MIYDMSCHYNYVCELMRVDATGLHVYRFTVVLFNHYVKLLSATH